MPIYYSKTSINILKISLKRFFQIQNTKRTDHVIDTHSDIASPLRAEPAVFDLDSDDINTLEELYNESLHTNFHEFTQHLHTSLPVVQSTVKPKSIF